MPQVLVPFVPGFLDDPAQVRADGHPDPDLFPLSRLHVADGGLWRHPQRARAGSSRPPSRRSCSMSCWSALMGALVLLAHDDAELGAVYVSWGTLVGGIAQLALVWWAVRRTGFLPQIPSAALRSRRPALLGAGAAGHRLGRHHPDQHLHRHHHRLGGRPAPSPISITPTGSISCRSASSASPSAWCCCPNSAGT